MNGLQRHVSRALRPRLRTYAPLIAIVPAASIYRQGETPAEPTWPFIRLGVSQTLPTFGTCYRGGDITVPIDAFAKARVNGSGQVLETAEDHAGRIGEAIEDCLHLVGETVTIGDAPLRLRYTMTDIRLFIDGAERDAFHYSAVINVRAMAE